MSGGAADGAVAGTAADGVPGPAARAVAVPLTVWEPAPPPIR